MTRLLALAALLFPFAASADGYGFRTPSGNIFCNGSVENGDISCTIVERSGFPPMPRPTSCGALWGHAFSLGSTGPARMECSNPARKSSYTDVAPYGVTGTFGPITCQSETSGLTCRNRSGHGFHLSRASQRVF
ncbi:DUF6636 domain-containing protein [Jannaschia formosa]|uniref:DUF6636 domain-containing protein n=1 Tax=Jannaschia formosa TaxID=2259592 RepID=UPI000E1C1E90|nr:DUF6636 domain-containing protein [Jannaschia formosa]TFL17564.1 hypothetical protein DR046_14135 [Jannaschia formosa]